MGRDFFLNWFSLYRNIFKPLFFICSCVCVARITICGSVVEAFFFLRLRMGVEKLK